MFDRLSVVIPLPSSSNYSTVIAHSIINAINNRPNRNNNEADIINAFRKQTLGELRDIAGRNNDNAAKIRAIRNNFFLQDLTPSDLARTDMIRKILNDVLELINSNDPDNTQISSKRLTTQMYRNTYLPHPIMVDPASNFANAILNRYYERLNNIAATLNDRDATDNFNYQNWWNINNLDDARKAKLKKLYQTSNNIGLDIAICDDDKVSGSTERRVLNLIDQDIKQPIREVFEKINLDPDADLQRMQVRVHKFYSFCDEK